MLARLSNFPKGDSTMSFSSFACRDLRLVLTLGIVLCLTVSIAAAQESSATKYPSFGAIERKDPAFDKLLPKDSKLEKLATGFDWAEGPVWCKKEVPGSGIEGAAPYLLFSDIPPNRIMKWLPGTTKAIIFMHPAGYTGKEPRGGEPGTNGLVLDKEGHLV